MFSSTLLEKSTFINLSLEKSENIKDFPDILNHFFSTFFFKVMYRPEFFKISKFMDLLCRPRMYSLQILQYTTKKLITLRENKILLDRRFVVHRRFVVQVPVLLPYK
jgi:hypothetical protein